MDIKPDITEVRWGKTIRTGDYENVRLDLTARVNEGQDWKEVLRAVRHIVRDYETAIREKQRPPAEG